MTTELMGNENEYLLEVNCLPHILHNAVKYTIEKNLFGFKSCVTKVFNYFMFIHQRSFRIMKSIHFTNIQYAETLRYIYKVIIMMESILCFLYS